MKLLIIYFMLTILLVASNVALGSGFAMYVMYKKQEHRNKLILINEAETKCGTNMESFKVYTNGDIEVACGVYPKDGTFEISIEEVQ